MTDQVEGIETESIQSNKRHGVCNMAITWWSGPSSKDFPTFIIHLIRPTSASSENVKSWKNMNMKSEMKTNEKKVPCMRDIFGARLSQSDCLPAPSIVLVIVAASRSPRSTQDCVLFVQQGKKKKEEERIKKNKSISQVTRSLRWHFDYAGSSYSVLPSPPSPSLL